MSSNLNWSPSLESYRVRPFGFLSYFSLSGTSVQPALDQYLHLRVHKICIFPHLVAIALVLQDLVDLNAMNATIAIKRPPGGTSLLHSLRTTQLLLQTG